MAVIQNPSGPRLRLCTILTSTSVLLLFKPKAHVGAKKADLWLYDTFVCSFPCATLIGSLSHQSPWTVNLYIGM